MAWGSEEGTGCVHLMKSSTQDFLYHRGVNVDKVDLERMLPFKTDLVQSKLSLGCNYLVTTLSPLTSQVHSPALVVVNKFIGDVLAQRYLHSVIIFTQFALNRSRNS